MALTAAEQYLIELINRARLDPAAEAKRYGVSLNQGLSSGTIDGSAKQVLAPNRDLEQAAVGHSQWMLGADVFSHTGSGGSSAGERMQDAGYDFTGSFTWRENLAWTGSTGSVSLSQAIRDHHEGLYRSAGHRANTFAEKIQEVGIGQVSGKFSYQGTNFNASMLTEKFAASGNTTFVTGVAYRDGNKNAFYSLGEGRSDYWFRGGGDGDKTAGSGGYAIDVGDRNAVTVTVGKGDTTLSRVEIDVSDGNAKLDLLLRTDGSRELHLSGSADLKSGVTDARLLGVADLDLAGTSRSNDLRGNKGDNRISGEGGNDRMWGAEGHDRMYGGGGADKINGGKGADRVFGGATGDRLSGSSGNDKLYGNEGFDKIWGGSGNDVLVGGKHSDTYWGGSGADRFVFHEGKDVVKDFQNNTDTIVIARKYAATVSEALDQARMVNGDAVFDFGDGHKLTIEDVGGLGALSNDIDIL